MVAESNSARVNRRIGIAPPVVSDLRIIIRQAAKICKAIKQSSGC
jgi:hypothetical protein